MAITFKDFQTLHGTTVPGRARKMQSDMIMDATFDQDIQYQVGYFFDYYHTTPENRLKLEGFDPVTDPNPVPVDVKFIAHSKKTYEKDEVTMHIQFRPGHACAVDYYDEVFGKRYNARYPVGLYVWLRGEDNIYRRWLVVATADRDENQFPTWEVLRCDDIFRWIKNGKFYEFPGVSRSQNSYNSGLWLDYKFQQPEDQTKFALPLNRDTEHLYYNTRLIIDAAVKTEPRAWLISKINRANSKGIAIYTTTQDLFNQHTDKADYDEDGNVVAWWADWYSSNIEPTPIDTPTESSSSITSVITCSGKQQFKVGGSDKTFAVTFYDGNQEVIDHEVGSWVFKIGDADAASLLTTTAVPGTPNKIKVKFDGDDDYIGKILTITHTSGDVVSSLDVEIVPL